MALIPLRRPVRFVSRDAFARASRSLPLIDADRLTADIDAVVDDTPADPFERARR